MTTLHIRHRLRGMRTKRQWNQTLSFVIALVSALVLAVAGLVWIDDQLARADEAETKATQASFKVSSLEQSWISCLENRSVWINDQLHTCSLMNTHFARGDFK